MPVYEVGTRRTVDYAATITTTWTGAAAPYTQEITVTGLLATDTPIIDIAGSDTWSDNAARESAFAHVKRIVCGADKITVYADEAINTAIPIKIKAVR